MEELWEEVEGFPGYFVSNFGNVKSLKRKVQKTLRQNTIDGYKYVKLYSPDIVKTLKVHRLVAKAFLQNEDNLPEVNHIIPDKSNNRVTNLEWVSHIDNIRHAYKEGIVPIKRGEDNGMSILTEQDVIEIRDKYIPREYSYRKLAKEYGVSAAKICQVVHNKAWSHIK